MLSVNRRKVTCLYHVTTKSWALREKCPINRSLSEKRQTGYHIREMRYEGESTCRQVNFSGIKCRY